MTSASKKRVPLNKERIVEMAIDVADADGLGALTMRRLGQELGVEAMALYRHFPNKEAILDGIIESIVDSVVAPSGDRDWRDILAARARSARVVFTDHSWAIGLLEGRSMGEATMHALDATLGRLRDAGFTIDDAVHALWLVDSFVYGHVIQEASFMDSDGADEAAIAAGLQELADGGLPHLAELGRRALDGGFSYDDEFDRGLTSILDAIERAQVG
jgi:AcrR family transcriptional regulator